MVPPLSPIDDLASQLYTYLLNQDIIITHYTVRHLVEPHVIEAQKKALKKYAKKIAEDMRGDPWDGVITEIGDLSKDMLSMILDHAKFLVRKVVGKNGEEEEAVEEVD